MNIVGVDPGPERSAWCMLTDTAVAFGYHDNNNVVACVESPGVDVVAIEDVRPYSVMGRTTLDTVQWVGTFRYFAGDRAVLLTASQVGSILIGDSRAKTAQLRAYVYDQFGGSRQAAVGTKKVPGPLYRVMGNGDHKLHALCVALAARKQLETVR